MQAPANVLDHDCLATASLGLTAVEFCLAGRHAYLTVGSRFLIPRQENPRRERPSIVPRAAFANGGQRNSIDFRGEQFQVCRMLAPEAASLLDPHHAVARGRKKPNEADHAAKIEGSDQREPYRFGSRIKIPIS